MPCNRNILVQPKYILDGQRHYILRLMDSSLKLKNYSEMFLITNKLCNHHSNQIVLFFCRSEASNISLVVLGASLIYLPFSIPLDLKKEICLKLFSKFFKQWCICVRVLIALKIITMFETITCTTH